MTSFFFLLFYSILIFYLVFLSEYCFNQGFYCIWSGIITLLSDFTPAVFFCLSACFGVLFVFCFFWVLFAKRACICFIYVSHFCCFTATYLAVQP